MQFRWPFTDRLDRFEANQRLTLAFVRVVIETQEKFMSAFADVVSGQAVQSEEIKLVLAALATDVSALTDSQTKLAAALANRADPAEIDAIVADQNANIAAMAAVLPQPQPAPAASVGAAPAQPAATS